MKTCTLCEERKMNTDFYPHPNTSDGLQSICKTCIKVSNKVRRMAYQRVCQDYPVSTADQVASVVVTSIQ